MRSRSLIHVFMLVCLVTAVLFIGCKKLSPLEKIEYARAEVEVELTNWLIRTAPQVEEEADPEASVEDGDEEGDSGIEGEETLDAVPPNQDVILDLYVKRGKADLPGITVDVTQVDAQENDKSTAYIWIEFDSIAVGSTAQVTKVLEGLSLEEGDKFAVEVNLAVAPEDRGNYQEYSG